jgi:hypothetical protein
VIPSVYTEINSSSINTDRNGYENNSVG